MITFDFFFDSLLQLEFKEFILLILKFLIVRNIIALIPLKESLQLPNQ